MAEKYGIKISIPNYDAKEATPEQCSINPDYLCPKIKLDQKPAHFGVYSHTFASQPSQGETVLFSMDHNLGHKPMHLCLIKFGSGSSSRALPLPAQSGVALQIYAYATTTQFKIAINSADGTPDPTGETWVFKYYIFVESGA